MSLRALSRDTVTPIAVAVATAVAGAGCAGGGGAPAATVAVTATDTTCEVDKASVPAGTVRFDVANRGSVITEVYLYGAGDNVVDEVENIEPGDRTQFTAQPGGGRYTVACKPGQLGDGIRTALEVTGEPAGDEERDPATARGVDTFGVQVSIEQAGFGGQFADLVIVRGQTVTFDVVNHDSTEHTFAVVGPDGAMELARSAPIEPGATAAVAVDFQGTGTHTATDPQAPTLTATFEVIE